MGKKKRLIVLMGIMLITMMGMTGCMSEKERMEEEMLAHMYEKYGVEFEVQEFIGRGIDCSYDVWYCNAKGDHPETDRIEVHRWYGGEETEYSDDYFSRLVRDEVERKIGEVVDNYVPEYKIYMSLGTTYASEEYCSITQLEDYVQDPDRGSAFKIFIYLLDTVNDEDFYSGKVEK